MWAVVIRFLKLTIFMPAPIAMGGRLVKQVAHSSARKVMHYYPLPCFVTVCNVLYHAFDGALVQPRITLIQPLLKPLQPFVTWFHWLPPLLYGFCGAPP
jgi:hypothetical protein